MGVKLPRTKPRVLLASVLYRLIKLPILSREQKFKLFLNLEWIFDRLSHEMSFEVYSPQNHPFRIHSKRFLLDFINESHHVLDLGCGTGVISNNISVKAKKVVGLDHSKAAIETARENYRNDNLEFVQSDAGEYLEKNSRAFDVLILSHILEHLDEPDKFLLTFKDEFRFIYIELPDFDRCYLNHYRKDLDMNLIYSDSDHVAEFSRDELLDLLKQCDLEVIESEYIFGVQKLWCAVKGPAKIESTK